MGDVASSPPESHSTAPPAQSPHTPSVSRTQYGHAHTAHVSSYQIGHTSHPPPREPGSIT